MLITVSILSVFACGRTDASDREPPRPFQKTVGYRIASPNSGQYQRFLLKTSAGPVTVASLGGIQRGSDLRLELITPVELTLEPGTVSVTVTAIGDSGAQLRAIGTNGTEARSAIIEISSRSISPVGCCSLPKSFTLDADLRR